MASVVMPRSAATSTTCSGVRWPSGEKIVWQWNSTGMVFSPRWTARVRAKRPTPHPAFAALTSALSLKGRGNGGPSHCRHEQTSSLAGRDRAAEASEERFAEFVDGAFLVVHWLVFGERVSQTRFGFHADI